MGSRAVIDVDSVILSKCHSGESLFEYYLQEFQYGKDVFQTTTNKYQDTLIIVLDAVLIMMRMVNSLFVWLW